MKGEGDHVSEGQPNMGSSNLRSASGGWTARGDQPRRDTWVWPVEQALPIVAQMLPAFLGPVDIAMMPTPGPKPELGSGRPGAGMQGGQGQGGWEAAAGKGRPGGQGVQGQGGQGGQGVREARGREAGRPRRGER